MHLKQIDGLRAIAVLGVVWSHAAPPDLLWDLGVVSGSWGIKLFFVISGYLITATLLRIAEAAQPERRLPVLRSFYIRRSLRVLPAYYAAILLGLMVAWRSGASTLLWNVLFLSNVQIAANDVWPPLTGHLWSLAIGAQFYLFWPTVLLVTPKQYRLVAAAVLTLIGPIALAVTYGWGGLDHVVATPVHFDTLGLGAVLAIVAHSDAHRSTRWMGGLWIGSLVLGAFAYLLAEELWRAAPAAAWAIRVFGVAMMLSGVVGFATRRSRALWGRVLECRPLRYVGRISYGVYLYHLLVLHVVRRLFGYTEFEVSLFVFLGTLLGSIVLADVSWRLLEDPINRLKRFFPDTASHTIRSRDLPGLYAFELMSAARRWFGSTLRIGMSQRDG